MPSAPHKSQVPIVDFAPFLNGTPSDRKSTATQIYQAFKTVGFVYLINHGVPQEKVNECFAWSKKFFDLPSEIKNLAPHPPSGRYHKGYSSVGKEKVVQMVYDPEAVKALRKAPDVKESFESGRQDDELYPNIWVPEEHIPGFRAFMEEYFATCRGTQCQILRAVALGMGLDETYFDPFHSDRQNQLRLLHYPPTPAKELLSGVKERIAAHTDFGTLTMLFQDDVGGLEVEDIHQKGVFHPAPPVEDAVVVNIGDFMQRWSNDELKSTMHRVRAPPADDETKMTKARYSVPYFSTANRDAIIDCLPTCWGEDRPKKYAPITSGDYIGMRLDATY
ncbi:flavonol synthase/flavanone 3-hydroxylase [Saitoella complicata NRRL Y-17804]|uniref:Fe2OG dioxygenase domain-containing protein n=1 Tax=Saitoella complicata (strain BCRC 22490 / CBS 7301 / JCM 7358 / NBRC 10748 / NRRL Y-17804) TaxID=698492 RepID=A0A0E9NR97_SAICN|nr:flavonol synthase/flavanone 3-hydroxylase [Saitoella complicata NRRL Y-17804]ODQ53420.1 flavonol synthase/flavanone 3-hydroxylase [Saitoella complicata NRRL Y-17804]GAO52374.1 hypothetical protein G7K_6452-t1 [Saitoella complicata NRRL Y-17804]